MSLDEIGIDTGTDKSSLLHDYLRHYEAAFSRFREQDINVLEIGISRGFSTSMWPRYFKRARIIAIDIAEHCRQYASDRVVVEIGSQDDPALLTRVARQYPLSIVIDDGSHIANHIEKSFEVLFPLLLPGGVYVIEDLFVHVGESAEKNRGGARVPLVDYLSDICQRIMVGRNPGGKFGHAIYDWVDSIQFVQRAAIICKRSQLPDPVSRINRAKEIYSEANDAFKWDRLSELLLVGGQFLDEAEAASRRAIARAPNLAAYHHRLSEALRRQGKRAEAILAAQRALDLAQASPKKAEYEGYLAKL